MSGKNSNGKRPERGPYLPHGLERPQIVDARVLAAMSRVPRHRLMPPEEADLAYADQAVSIGYDQTISQPFIVALMTQEAQITPGARVLEAGTGSGYQAAVLAEMGAEVFSIEIVPELAQEAATRLKELGYDTIHLRQGDGAAGWPEYAPFDAILVTAASPVIPRALVDQLREGGRMVIPIESESGEGEILTVIEKHGDKIEDKSLGAVRFVPFTGLVRGK